MKLETARKKIRERFNGKLNKTDMAILLNILESVDETARIETYQDHLKALRNVQASY